MVNLRKFFKQQDKQKHLIVGALLGFVSILLAIAGGLYKEIKDKSQGGKFDPQDLLATILGGLVGQAVSIIIFLLIFF